MFLMKNNGEIKPFNTLEDVFYYCMLEFDIHWFDKLDKEFARQYGIYYVEDHDLNIERYSYRGKPYFFMDLVQFVDEDWFIEIFNRITDGLTLERGD